MKKFEKCLCCKKSDVKTDISAEKKDKTLNTKETNVKAHMRTRKNKYHVLSAHGNQVFSEKPLSKHHKKNIFKKQVDYRQEPAKPDRKVNVNNSYGEKEVKVDYRILEERMETGDILLFNIKNFVNVIEVFGFSYFFY